MKKLLGILLALALLMTLPVAALAGGGSAQVYAYGSYYDFSFSSAELDGGDLVVTVDCSDGLPTVNGSPQAAATCAVDIGGERLTAYHTGITLVGPTALYFFYFHADAEPDAVWLYPEGDESEAELLWGIVADTMTFGHYEQDKDSSNGEEPIEWVILESDGEWATLISRYALDCKPYNDRDAAVTWETCTLRQWLNEDFLNAAFTEEEQARMQAATVTAEDNWRYETKAGKDTQDKVYLLSLSEFDRYFKLDGSSFCQPTQTAIARGVFASSVAGGGCRWWLRTPGSKANTAANTFPDGCEDNTGFAVNASEVGVRPVIRLWLPTDRPMPIVYPTLQKGAKGDDVVRLQQALIDGGYLSGKADGDFGGMTETAVKAAQEALGVEATGVADDALQHQLYGE